MNFKVKYLKPNRLRGRNHVASINIVWACDFTDLETKLRANLKNKIRLFLVCDLGNGEIVGAKVFNYNSAKKIKKGLGVSSKYISNFLKLLFTKYSINNSKTELILHSDRGTEFLSKEYTNLENDFNIKLSMSDCNKPTDNAVVERLIRTFKNQLDDIQPTIPKTIDTIQKLQSIINARVKKYNQDFKNKRSENLGSEKFRKIAVNSKIQIPDPALTHSEHLKHLRGDEHLCINEFRKILTQLPENYNFNSEKQFILEQILFEIKNLGENLIRKEMFDRIRDATINADQKETLEIVKELRDKNKNKNKNKYKKPKRLPLTKDIYHLIMNEPKIKEYSQIGYFRFRLITTILYYTGIRLQEASNITKEDWKQLKKTNRLQIYTSKTKNYRFLAMPEQAIQRFEQLEDEAEKVFKYSYQKNQKYIIKHTANTKNEDHNFRVWYNTQLRAYLLTISIKTKNPILYNNLKHISSHSFRINKVTTMLWKRIALEEVSAYIGHQSIQTTNMYYRWNANNPELLKKLTEIEE